METTSTAREQKWLILDAYSPRTLALVRSFGKRRIPFVLGGHERRDMCFYSRYAKERLIYTDPRVSISRFIQDLNQLSGKHRFDLIVPTAEATILACGQGRDQLDVPVLTPPDDVIQLVYSKRKVLQLAESVGVSIPITRYVNSSELDSTLQGVNHFPMAIKAEHSDRMCGDRVCNTGNTRYVLDSEQLVRECRLRVARSPLLVQQFIDGYGIGVSGVFRAGEPLALFGHRRLRESTPTGGPAAVMESIAVSDALRRQTATLMRQTGYSGPAMVEYKVERETGQVYLMEINCRLWGSIMFPLALGVDFPFLWWKSVNRLPIAPEESQYAAGKRGRYLLGDTKSLWLTLRGRPAGYPGAFPSRLAAVKAYLYSFIDPRMVNLLFSIRDAGPFWGRIRQGLANRHS